MKFTVRPFELKDHGELDVMLTRCWREAYAGIVDDAVIAMYTPKFRKEMREKRIKAREAGLERVVETIQFAADSNGSVCGHVFGFMQHEKNGCQDGAWLNALYVDMDHHGKGLGSALLKAFAQEVQAQGKSRFYLEVLSENEKAIAFYLKQGGEIANVQGVWEPSFLAGQGYEYPVSYMKFEISKLLDGSV